MKNKIKRIVKAHLKEKKGSNYVRPLNMDMGQHPYYQEQEKTDTNMAPMDTTHGPQEKDERNDKMLVYRPEEEVTNPDWGGGNFTAPYENELQQEVNRTPNNMETLYDPMRGAGFYNSIDLNSRSSSCSMDDFLGGSDQQDRNPLRISSFDLSNDFIRLSGDQLIHKSNKDLWKMFKNKKGDFFIQRMFEDGIQSQEEK